MPSFDPQDRACLYHYASDLRIWFQEWLLEPVQKATGGIIPAALSTLYADMNELENQFTDSSTNPSTSTIGTRRCLSGSCSTSASIGRKNTKRSV